MTQQLRRPGILLKSSAEGPKIKWKGAILPAGELVAQIALIPITAGGSIPSVVSSIKEFISAVSLDDTLETRAVNLISLAMARALDYVLPSEIVTHKREEITKVIRRQFTVFFTHEDRILSEYFIKSASDDNNIEELAKSISTEISRIVPFVESDLFAKILNSINIAIFEVVDLKREYFSDIFYYFENPALGAAIHDWEWGRYRRQLIHQFNVQPVFGQEETKVSLAQLYVPLAASWIKRQKSSTHNRVGQHWDDDLDERATSHVELLSDIIDRFISKPNAKDPIRLIFGGPGSGKSTFTKYISAQIAHDILFRPIYIELQRLKQTRDLHADIERLLTRELRIFSGDPLGLRGEEVRYVLIFDGLDELVVPNSNAADRIAADFASALVALLRELNTDGICRAQAIVTGRTQIAKSFNDSHELPDGALISVLNFVDPTDLRPVWWERFSQATGHSPILPAALEDERFEEITAEPLLCYLFALSGYLSEGWEEAAANHNLIYERLLGEVWVRRWGGQTLGNNRAGPTQALSSNEFSKLLETVALAAWWGGEIKSANLDRFDAALAVTKAEQAWAKFCDEMAIEERSGLSTLALTFYLAPSKTDGRGIEFTHKSFGEYLVGRFLVRHALTHVAEILKNPRFSVLDAAGWWCEFGSSGLITKEILSFMANEARLLSDEDLKTLIQELSKVLQFTIDEGLPVHKNAGLSSFWKCSTRIDLGH